VARAFSYLRFSRPEQRRGHSLKRQTEMATKYAESHNLILDESLTFQDLGHSAYRGSHAETGELGRFLAAIDSGFVRSGDYLLIENLDRLSRQSVGDAYDLLKSICNRGVIVVTLQDGKEYTKELLNTDFASLLIALSYFSRAHEESLTKSKRLSSAWMNKRSNIDVKPLTGKLPGWLCINDEKQVDVIPNRVQVVKQIFFQYLEGMSPRAIANGLNEANVEPWGLGKQKAEKWNTSYIQKVLDNEAVLGKFTPHKMEHEGTKKRRVPLNTVEGYFPMVVDAETFNRVQEVRNRNKLGRRKAAGGLTNAFSMLFRCRICGSFLVRVNKNSNTNWQYLVCGAAKAGYRDEETGYRLCPGGYDAVRYDKVEKAFVDAVRGGRVVSTAGAALRRVEAQIVVLKETKLAAVTRVTNLSAAIADGTLKGSSPIIFTESVPRPDGTVEYWTVREEIELAERGIKGAEMEMERLLLDREALKPRAIDAKIEELKRAVSGPELDRQKVNILLQALCDRAELNTTAKEMVFMLRHSETPVVIAWEA
jgi:DNA invertase Pin-like site-specific DNA recombinase